MEKKNLSRQETARTLRFLFGLWKIAPVKTTVFIVMQALFAITTSVVAPLFVATLLLHISNGSATLANSTGLLIGYVIILILGDVVSIRIAIMMAFLSESKMQAHVYDNVLGSLMEKDTTYHANRMSGGIVSDATKLHGSIERFWDTLAFNAVPIFTTIISVCIALSFIYWQYAAILFILTVIIGFLMNRAQNKIAPFSKATSEKSSATVAYFADVIGNITTVKAFAGEAFERKAFDGRIRSWQKANRREMRSVVTTTAGFAGMLTIMNIAAFVAAVLATQYHIGSVAVTYLVIVYTLNVVSQLWSVTGLTRAYIRILGDASPMIEMLATPPLLKDPQSPEPVRIHDGTIHFADVTFAHPESSEELFKDFNLTIAPGTRVGLVGHSGSGKTSLTRLLLRLSDVDSGTISIDDQAITTITQEDLRRHISYVPQEPLLFHRSLQENIAYGKPDATDTEIREAAQKAHALEFIDKLPQGFDTLVGERGVKLSGGQRQRIAIARAILKDAPILVLDEATSALDSESEKLIQDSLETLMKDRTSIVIAHRLSTIAKLDRIIVLENGTIIEDGTHAELLKQNGTYAKLWSHQSGGFIDE